jgi:nucleotide-binding universal stress UspA family protein
MSAVFARPLLATEHTEYDSGSEPLALALARRCGTPLAVVLPLISNPEYEAQAPAQAQRAEAEAALALQALRQMAQAAGVACSPTCWSARWCAMSSRMPRAASS